MEESNSEGRVRIQFLRKEKGKEEERVAVTPDMYLQGRVYASQNWAKKADAQRADAFTAGQIPDYRHPDASEAYTFRVEGSEGVYVLIGNGHHRTAAGILEGRPYSLEVGADLGCLPSELLNNPKLAMQKLAVLGVEGMWPFKEFMREFLKVRIDNNGK